jgi:hypothetical protein
MSLIVKGRQGYKGYGLPVRWIDLFSPLSWCNVVSPMSNTSVWADFAKATTGILVNHSRRGFMAACLSILIIATGLRMYHIGNRSLWFDEALVANLSGGSFHEMLTRNRHENSAPVVHPAIIYVTEKIDDGPLALRLPALVASLVAILILLAMNGLVGPRAAGLAALVLAVSASQIRYAQEVREYSLSVLCSSVLLYAFLAYTSPQGVFDTQHRSPNMLYLILFGVPLIQYGLALLGAATLTSMIVLFCVDRRGQVTLSNILAGSTCLGAGSLISFFLTLRFQWGAQSRSQDAFLHSAKDLVDRTMDLLTFILPVRPGSVTLFLAIGAMLFYIARMLFLRKSLPVLTLAAASFAIVATCASLRAYPYGGVRQCLFLAPLVALLLGLSLSDFIGLLPITARKLTIVGIVCAVLLSGASQIGYVNPYREVEDIQSVLKGLDSSIQPHDRVYIYYASMQAMKYYWKHRPPLFSYQSSRWGDAGWYVKDILTAVGPNTSRVWLVFSSVFNHEDQFIVDQVSKEWNVERTVSAQGASLYLARRPGDLDALCCPTQNGAR